MTSRELQRRGAFSLNRQQGASGVKLHPDDTGVMDKTPAGYTDNGDQRPGWTSGVIWIQLHAAFLLGGCVTISDHSGCLRLLYLLDLHVWTVHSPDVPTLGAYMKAKTLHGQGWWAPQGFGIPWRPLSQLGLLRGHAYRLLSSLSRTCT